MTFFQSLIGVISSSGAGGVPLDITTVGGTRNVVGIYSYHTWPSNNTFTLNTAADRDIEFCIIGGGASAGRNQGGTTQPGGGGGAGEQVYGTYSSMPAGTWNAIIGAGGAAVSGTYPQQWMYGNNGSQTYSSQTSGSGGDQLRANGGGAGMTVQAGGAWYSGLAGGGGGGASATYGNNGVGGSVSAYSPNPSWTTNKGNAGGGGIGSAGSGGSNLSPWNFYANPISGGPAGYGATHALTIGSSTIASTTGVGGAAGGGGGGNGSTAPSGVAASNSGASAAAPANSGSGSSSAQENYDVGAGGSGYVIIRWVTLV